MASRRSAASRLTRLREPYTRHEELKMSNNAMIARFVDNQSNNNWVPVESQDLTPSGPGRVTPNDSWDARCGCK